MKTKRAWTWLVAGGVLTAAAASLLREPLGATAAAPAGRVHVGSLVGREGRFEVHATSAGTRFDLLDARGEPVATNLTAAEVDARFPGLNLREAVAGEPVKLMLAEPPERGE